MTATGQLIPLPMLPLIRVRDEGDRGRGLAQERGTPEPWVHRVYRAPRSESFRSRGVYGPDGRVDLQGITGRTVDLYV